MNCPKCGGSTVVVDSRVKKLGIQRRRECLSCRCRFNTIEVDLDAYTALADAPDAAVRLKWKKAMDTIQACLAELPL